MSFVTLLYLVIASAIVAILLNLLGDGILQVIGGHPTVKNTIRNTEITFAVILIISVTREMLVTIINKRHQKRNKLAQDQEIVAVYNAAANTIWTPAEAITFVQDRLAYVLNIKFHNTELSYNARKGFITAIENLSDVIDRYPDTTRGISTNWAPANVSGLSVHWESNTDQTCWKIIFKTPKDGEMISMLIKWPWSKDDCEKLSQEIQRLRQLRLI